MENKEIVEGNKLIAEFMGWTIHPKYGKDYLISKDKNRISPPYYTEINYEGKLSDFTYHSSWDWLMPVVEKIGQVVLDGGQYGKHVDFQISTNDGTGWIFWMKNIPGDLNQPQAYLNSGTLIKKTYYAVVEFIKWYNNGK